MGRLFVGFTLDAVFIDPVHPGIRVSHEDGGMRGDNELRALFSELVHAGEYSQLALRRERRFGLVEDVETLAVKAVHDEGEKRFAMRLVVQGASAVGMNQRWSAGIGQIFDFRGHVVETFCTEKEPVFGLANAAGNAQIFMQAGVRGIRAEIKIACAPLRD